MNHETETLLPEPERTPSGREGSSLVAVLGSRIGIRNQRGGPRPGQIRPFYVRKTPHRAVSRETGLFGAILAGEKQTQGGMAS